MISTDQSRVGTYLRETREGRGISLAQAAADTRILQRYLIALEEGEYHHLPGDVYTRGFIRNYAQYLDLPAEEIVELYRAERGSTGPIRVVPAAVPPRTRSCLVPSTLMVFIVVTVLVIGGYLVLNSLGLTTIASTDDRPTATRPAASPQPLPTPSGQPVQPDGATSVVIVPNTQVPPTATTQPTPAAPVEVTVRIVDGTSWMRVTVDGQVRIESVQNAGWTQTFQGQRTIIIRAGNAAVVEVSYNGQAPARMAQQQGQVVEKTYTPSSD